ncbi:hypothetical protein ACHAWO_000406 [Cyclotella atomus]|uniref:Actin-related protein 5 n=1 Tax=Cyclotella atomus TaxID=382360 RepID=A0ABD3QD03_9STRA
MATTKEPAKKEPAKKATNAKPKATSSQPKKKPTENTATSTTCIIDNGGWQIKYGISNNNSKPSTMPNCTARPPHQLTVLAGDEILRMKNRSQLVYNHSLERGMIVDGSTQCEVWTRLLNVCGVNILPSSLANNNKGGGLKKMIATNVNSNNVQVVLLVPPFVPSVISEGVDKILFRELGVGRVVKVLGGCMAAVRYLEEGRAFRSSFDGKAQNNDDLKSGETYWINDDTKCCCVVDSGHSFTHVIPTRSEAAVEHAIKRLDIGGKVLTNLLKEAVTYRQWNMMDEYHVVNDAKEQLCFISQEFNEDMKHARQTRRGLRKFDREFLLPDFVNTFQGTVQLPMPLQMMRELEEDKRQQLNKEKEKAMKRENNAAGSNENVRDEIGNDLSDQPKQKKKRNRSKVADENVESEQDENDAPDVESDEETEQQRLKRVKQMREQEQKRREAEAKDRQALALSVERFAVPEVLFTPSDLGLDVGGIADAIVESINACDATVRAAMYHNVLLVGGNAKMPGFKNRVETELRKLAPTQYAVRVFLPEDPLSYAWEGAKIFSQRPDFREKLSIDRVSWESMKKAGADQQDIWGDRIYNKQP